jgi:hypothetical protein
MQTTTYPRRPLRWVGAGSAKKGQVGATLAVVGLSAERAGKEARIRDDMIRVAHRAGASIRQLAEVSGLGRKTVTATISSNIRVSD